MGLNVQMDAFSIFFLSVKFRMDVCLNEQCFLQRERETEKEKHFLGKWKLNYRSFHTRINGNINPHTHIYIHIRLM